MSQRCDRCGAAAKNQVVLASGAEMLFCQHHTNNHYDALRAGGARVLSLDAPALT
jgi:hypothetical protein